MTPRHADVVVIGGGVVGLAIAREIRRRDPTARVVVFDKEEQWGAHASGRNSGVLHAGFYYSPDSLKARLTRRGNELLTQFCAEHGAAVRETGKVVVATESTDIPRLAELARRAAANDVPVSIVTPDELVDLEPLARTVGHALWSPTTAVADPVAVTTALALDTIARGVVVRLGEPVLAARPGEVLTSQGRYAVGHIVNCAGLQADRVAGWFGMADDYVVLPFKGVYRYLSWAPGRLRRHVYPVPDPAFPFLGVHVTVTAEGRAKIGPTAIPVLSRENYRRLRGVDLRDTPRQTRHLLRFLATPAARGLVSAEVRKYRPGVLAADAARLVPAIGAKDLAEPGAPGIRAQLMHVPSGQLEMDFVVRGDQASTHVLNAVSPAWTSALAVAEHVVAGLLDTAPPRARDR